ncbi:MAG: SelT/SelW/SelH family protein [Methyloceanibacter sp.]|uniref:SelT/SelW/SelH family protein n=1 Tax=Methyloceanibacter sp. TaxID=1965321 RepID=UPI001DFDDD8F|nr:SelT/SelW/SelH family protein [Methyloceanibacter sp.]MCB1442396.1 SelT/SelW/SelH family protein [Methyloceanibacter sp.]
MTAPTPNIAITYCRLCNWMLRAAWMGQELLSTFAGEAGSLTLIPDDTGGVFEVRIDGNLIWSRSEKGRFPEIAELKQIVRDRIAPAHDLGHADRDHAGHGHADPGHAKTGHVKPGDDSRGET